MTGSFQRWAVFGATLAASLGPVGATGAGVDPFQRPTIEAPVAAVADTGLETLELTGVSTLGGQTRVCLTDRAAGRSRWIEIGAGEDGFLALAYDPARDAVHVQRGVADRWVPLRKATITALTLPRTEGGAIDWVHLRMSDREKAREAEAMVTDILEVAQLGRAGKLRATP